MQVKFDAGPYETVSGREIDPVDNLTGEHSSSDRVLRGTEKWTQRDRIGERLECGLP